MAQGPCDLAIVRRLLGLIGCVRFERGTQTTVAADDADQQRRLVLVVIDALRHDFVAGADSPMAFTRRCVAVCDMDRNIR